MKINKSKGNIYRNCLCFLTASCCKVYMTSRQRHKMQLLYESQPGSMQKTTEKCLFVRNKMFRISKYQRHRQKAKAALLCSRRNRRRLCPKTREQQPAFVSDWIKTRESLTERILL